MPDHRVAIVAGARTPFVKGGQAFAALGPLTLARHAVQGQRRSAWTRLSAACAG